MSLMLVVLAAGKGLAEDLPVVKGKKVVASVQGEPITLDELDRQVSAMKREPAPGAKPDRSVELAVLRRMIHVTLIAQEAKRMGVDKLPETRKAVEAHARVALREELVGRVVKDVKADGEAVDAAYRASVQEWQVSAALFANEEHARSLAAEVSAGVSFGDRARAYLADGRATKVEDGVVLRRETMDPAIGKAVAGMAVGSTSSIIATRSGLVILKLEDIRYPDNSAARATAERIVLTAKRKEVLAAFDRALRKKYVTIDREVLASVDYESDRPGMDALLKDTRVVAAIRGEKPVTVAEMSEALKFQFFHGTTLAAERKRLNARKEQILDGMLHRKVFRKEALRLRLDRTDSYKSQLKAHEQSTLFGAMVLKVIAPDVKLNEDGVKAYYAEHRKEFTTPEMMRLRSLAFADRTSAQAALESLKKGADFQWVASRADGQVDGNAKGVMSFDGKPIMTSELPDGIRTSVAGARAGDVRLHASPESHVYVLAVEDVAAAAPQPYDEVRGQIARKVLDADIQKAVEQFAERLRSLSDVKVYLEAS